MTNFNLNTYHTLILDFDGVFTNNKVYLNELGQESIMCDKSDSMGFNLLNAYLKKFNLEMNCFVLSKEKNKVIELRLKKLKIKCYQGIDNKIEFIKKYLKDNYLEKKLSNKGIIYIGNDINDLESILFSGYSFCPIDSHDLVKNNVRRIINKEGGNGFIRECIEEIINFKNLNIEEIIELLK